MNKKGGENDSGSVFIGLNKRAIFKYTLLAVLVSELFVIIFLGLLGYSDSNKDILVFYITFAVLLFVFLGIIESLTVKDEEFPSTSNIFYSYCIFCSGLYVLSCNFDILFGCSIWSLVFIYFILSLLFAYLNKNKGVIFNIKLLLYCSIFILSFISILNYLFF